MSTSSTHPQPHADAPAEARPAHPAAPLPTTRNGIDTDQLRALGDAMVAHPPAAAASIELHTSWQQGYQLTTHTRGLTCGGEQLPRAAELPADRPHALGGTDTAAAPGELLLAALGACVTQAFVESAAAQDVEVSACRIAVTGHLDLRGTLGAPEVRPGLSRIDLDAEVAAAADERVLEQLLAVAVARSPVADSLAAGVTIEPRLRHVQPV